MLETGLSPLALAAVLTFIWGLHYLRRKKAQQHREMLHRERMLAIEKGIPLPELPLEDNGSAATHYPNALPNAALGCGLIPVSLGLGVVVAFQFARIPDLEVPTDLWAVGFLPLMVGSGCLTYYRLLRRP